MAAAFRAVFKKASLPAASRAGFLGERIVVENQQLYVPPKPRMHCGVNGAGINRAGFPGASAALRGKAKNSGGQIDAACLQQAWIRIGQKDGWAAPALRLQPPWRRAGATSALGGGLRWRSGAFPSPTYPVQARASELPLPTFPFEEETWTQFPKKPLPKHIKSASCYIPTKSMLEKSPFPYRPMDKIH